ncbi:hypothetical protein [Ekhidna sp.]|uniref:hypothetical protein n=1 Tax=Ekhidna sp. TaxID=2608089 RepID=UPI003B5033F0
MKEIRKFWILGLVFTLVLSSCGDDDLPPEENEEEVIDRVTLTFTPDDGGTTVVATATDPDGEGVENFETQTINLAINTSYDLAISIENTQEGENITEEIEAEAEEHMFFFSFTDGIFSDPSGNGNIADREGTVNYDDYDTNDNPVGLSTTWFTAGASPGDGEFRILLKHQPDVKSATSTSNDGETDIDITWTINISE